MGVPLLRACALVLAGTAFLPAWARRSVLPYRAVVEISAAPKVGEAGWRDELADLVTARLRARGCVAAVQEPGATEADLRVRVRVEDLRRETSFDASLAQTVSPDASPEVRDGRTARLRATLLVELVLMPGEEPLEQRRLNVDVRRTPRSLGEDVEAAARQEAMEEVSGRVAQFVCRAKAPKR